MGKQKLFRVQALNEKGMMIDVEVMGHKARDTAEHSARFNRWKACGGAGWTY